MAEGVPSEACQGGNRASESRLRLAIDAGRMAVWEYDVPAGRIISTPELNRLLGYPAEAQIEIEDIRRSYFPGERERVAEAGRAALAKGERFFEVEYRFYHRDGSLRWH